MTGANIILGDFNSYLGNMKYDSHLNAAEQGIWGPISGDPSPSHAPSRESSKQNANTRGKWLKNLLTSSELVVLNSREHNIAQYKTFTYTHIQKLRENSATLTSETIIDYALTNKGYPQYIHLCGVIADTHEKISGTDGRGVGDHELIEMKIPYRGGVDRDTQRHPGQAVKTKETKRLQNHDQKLTETATSEKYMDKLKETCQVAVEVINDLFKTIPKNPGQSQNKSDKAFQAVIVAIDTAAQTTVGSSFKSVNLQPRKRKPVQPRDLSPEIKALFSDKIMLQRQLMYIRAEPAHPTLAQRTRTKLLELYSNLVKIRETTRKDQIKEKLSFLLDSPDGSISQNTRTFGLSNTNTWKLTKQVNGIQEPTPHLPDNIYTNNGPSPLSAWTRGPLASNTQDAGKAWNEFRRALENIIETLHSRISMSTWPISLTKMKEKGTPLPSTVKIRDRTLFPPS